MDQLFGLQHRRTPLTKISPKPPFNNLPINNLPQRRQMRSPSILVIQIISMLPDIKGQQRLQTLHHGIGCPLLLGNNQ